MYMYIYICAYVFIRAHIPRYCDSVDRQTVIQHYDNYQDDHCQDGRPRPRPPPHRRRTPGDHQAGTRRPPCRRPTTQRHPLRLGLLDQTESAHMPQGCRDSRPQCLPHVLAEFRTMAKVLPHMHWQEPGNQRHDQTVAAHVILWRDSHIPRPGPCLGCFSENRAQAKRDCLNGSRAPAGAPPI